jgi:hypothetical protein
VSDGIGILDTEEVTGSNPVRPTRHLLFLARPGSALWPYNCPYSERYIRPVVLDPRPARLRRHAGHRQPGRLDDPLGVAFAAALIETTRGVGQRRRHRRRMSGVSPLRPARRPGGRLRAALGLLRPGRRRLRLRSRIRRVGRRSGVLHGKSRTFRQTMWKHDDQVTVVDRRDVGTGVLDDTDALVSYRLAIRGNRHRVVRMQVRSADARADDADDRVSWLLDGGVGNVK